MSTKKPTEDHDKLQAELKKELRRNEIIRNEIKRMELYKKNKDSEFWLDIKSKLFVHLDALNNDLDNYESLLYNNSAPLVKAVSLLEGRKQLKFFANIVDYYVANEKNFQDKLLESDGRVRKLQTSIANAAR